MADENLFKLFATADTGKIIATVEQMLQEPWNTGADEPIQYFVDGIEVTSSEDADSHELEFIRSVDLADDHGELITKVMHRAEPVVTEVADAAAAAWGESHTVSMPKRAGRCTLLELILGALGVEEVGVWHREDRCIVFMDGIQRNSNEYAAAFLVTSRGFVEDSSYFMDAPEWAPVEDVESTRVRGSLEAKGPLEGASALEQHLRARLSPGRHLPEPLTRVWSYMESQGWGGADAHGDPFLTAYPGDRQLGAVFSATLTTRGYLDPEAPGADRLLPIAETDGSGGFAAIWYDEADNPRFFWFSSEGGEPQRIAENPVDFLRLIAVGYPELVDWAWGAPPEFFDDLDDDDDEASQPDPAEAHRGFREWVQTEFGVEVPGQWDVEGDPEFDAWSSHGERGPSNPRICGHQSGSAGPAVRRRAAEHRSL